MPNPEYTAPCAPLTSISGLLARGNHLAYSAANAALENLTRSLARVLAPEIRINAVNGGITRLGKRQTAPVGSPP